MADPTIIWGGVTLQKNEVAKMYETNYAEQHPMYAKNEKVYVVEFKSGVKAAYRGADNATPGIKPFITSNLEELTDRVFSETWGVLGLQIKGNEKKRDIVEITGGTLIGANFTDGGHDDITVHGSQALQQICPYFFTLASGYGEIDVDKIDNTSIRLPNEKEYTHGGGNPFKDVRRTEQ